MSAKIATDSPGRCSGWPADLSDDEVLLRLVVLNRDGADEESRGLIRWLRPVYQNPTGAQAAAGKTAEMELGAVAKLEKAPWPKTLPDQIARRFLRARTATVQPLLDSLVSLGQAERGKDGRYAA